MTEIICDAHGISGPNAPPLQFESDDFLSSFPLKPLNSLAPSALAINTSNSGLSYLKFAKFTFFVAVGKTTEDFSISASINALNFVLKAENLKNIHLVILEGTKYFDWQS